MNSYIIGYEGTLDNHLIHDDFDDLDSILEEIENDYIISIDDVVNLNQINY